MALSAFGRIVLKPGRDLSVRRFHPWIFSGAIAESEPGLEEGAVVDVFSARGGYLATGHFGEGSLAVKIFSFSRTALDLEFWISRLTSARALRAALGLFGSARTTAFRLVNGEGDNLPGLIIDLYNRSAVVQFHSLGMYRERTRIAEALQALFGRELESVYAQPLFQGERAGGEHLLGDAAGAIIFENDLQFHVDWQHGQKTGFFIDQRDNRELLSAFCRGKRVLNAFCYTGAFTAYALRGGALHVDSVDASESALKLTQQNVELNFPRASHATVLGDVFSFLEQTDRSYEVIVLDPPAFAKHQNALRSAIKGYRGLNQLALRRLTEGGVLFTFSCSQLVRRDQFRLAVMGAAQEVGRRVQVLHELHQAPCHPVSIYHPEGEYLKGLVLCQI